MAISFPYQTLKYSNRGFVSQTCFDFWNTRLVGYSDLNLFLQVILDKDESVIETYKFEMSFNNDASHRLAEADKVF